MLWKRSRENERRSRGENNKNFIVKVVLFHLIVAKIQNIDSHAKYNPNKNSSESKKNHVQ